MIRTSDILREKAYAKLNLSLDVLAKRPDGFHDLCMVMQSVALHDDVSILLNNEGRFYAQSDRRYLPNDERNIALRAAKLYLERTGHPIFRLFLFFSCCYTIKF